MRFLPTLALTSLAALVFTGLPATAAHSSNLDTDGDGLLDVWETKGYDYNGDGTIDIDFPALGANPKRKDLFVEMDYMPGELASKAELDTIVRTFKELPVSNPDRSKGITLHLDAGSIYPAYDLGGGQQIAHRALSGVGEVQELRKQYSSPARERVFHYMIWGDYYGDSGSSGQAFVNGREFLVTVGKTRWRNANSSTRIGTFIHELGHNLGLGHGGTDSVNFKPNYLSIMNYKYQLTGLQRTNGTTYYGYSTVQGMTMDENRVREQTGLGAASRGFYTSINNRRWVANRGIDFNGDRKISTAPQKIDLNGDGQFTQLTAPNDLATLRFQVEQADNYWRDIPVVESNELTAELAQQLGYLPAA